MTFLAPAFFYVSLAVAAGVLALHVIVTRQPRAGVLPTARFIPDLPATATARAKRPSDMLLMLLRVLLILAAGAGMAKPVFKPSRRAEARVILVDISRSVQDSIAVRDSVRALYRNGDAVVAFDSAARILGWSASDSLSALRPTTRPGNLAAGLIAALRAGSTLRDRADSVQLIIVSPFAAEELNASTDSIRKLWRGRARLVRAGGSTNETPVAAAGLEIDAPPDDALQATGRLAKNLAGTNALVVRLTGRDAATEAAGSRAVVEWPAAGRPRRAVDRRVTDTIGGVVAGDALVVAAFQRRWVFPADSLRDAEVIARWIDGEPAAIEMRNGAGCMRSVAIPVSPIGDLVIRDDFVQFVAALSRECSQTAAMRPGDQASLTGLMGRGGLAPRDAFKPRRDVHSRIGVWLLGLAMILAVLELFVRRRRKTTDVFATRLPTEARAA